MEERESKRGKEKKIGRGRVRGGKGEGEEWGKGRVRGGKGRESVIDNS